MQKNSFLTPSELETIGFQSVGQSVQISRNAVFYNPQNVSVGDNTRIDDQVVISAGSQVKIGRYVHLSLGVSILGKGGVTIEDFVSVSVKTSIFSSNDDYSGAYMTNPTVPGHLTNVDSGLVQIRKHVIIGAHCVILPHSDLGAESAYGALSLMKGKYESNAIYAGSPAKKIGVRQNTCEKLSEELS